MKIEIEIPDLEQIYFSDYEEESITGEDIKKKFVDVAIDAFIQKMYNDYVDDSVQYAMSQTAAHLIKANSDMIIDKVVSIVSDTILKKKAIVNEMPKKKEIADINKEWEQYFMELVDKAIAKRFK